MKLKLKTFGVGLLVFTSCWVIFGFLFNVPTIHGLYEKLETFIYFKIFTSTATPSDDLIIIDEENNEYDRDIFARLITKLDSLGARVIALDILFQAEQNFVQNRMLIRATENASDKVIHGVEFIEVDNQVVIPERFNLEIQPSEDLIEAKGALLPFRDLLDVTAHLGHVIRSADESLREAEYFPHFVQYNNRVYPSLALAAVAYFSNCQIQLQPEESPENVVLIHKETKRLMYEIPINSRGQAIINFIQKDKFSGKIFSVEKAFELCEDASNAHVFRKKIILIGCSFDTQDQWFGPGFQVYPSLIVMGTQISQILNDENIDQSLSASIWFSLFLILLTFVVFRYIKMKFPQRWAFYSSILYLLGLVLFLIFANVTIGLRTKTLVLLPYIVFLLTTYITTRYYDISRVRVFVSYSRKDETFTKKLAKSLKLRGIDLWLFQTNLDPGDRWQEKTHAAVLQCPKFLIVLSDSSVESKFVQFEFETAVNVRKIIVPLLLCEESKIPDILRGYQYADFRETKDFEERVEELARAILKSESSKTNISR